MGYFEAIVLAIVEGLTEFLPVSSTGHMVIVSSMLGMDPTPFTKTFTVAIQLGAIMAVVVLYKERFFQSFRIYLMLAIGVVPALLFGFFFNDWIDHVLGRVDIVAAGLIIGGIVLLFADDWFEPEGKSGTELTPLNAFTIGLFQCLSVLLPGLSRSAATIIGGLTRGLSRKESAEFSFLLAVPTMAAATSYKLLRFFLEGNRFEANDLPVLVTGNMVAFVVAWIAIRFFIRLLEREGFRIFGIYRILAGITILALLYSGFELTLP